MKVGYCFSIPSRTMTTWTAQLSSLPALLVFAGCVFPVRAQTAAGEDNFITIESDMQSADNITGVVTAIGNVRIVYPPRGIVSTSRQAQYFSREEKLVLSGDVDVVRDAAPWIRADRVASGLAAARALAHPTPGQQVQSILLLKQSPDAQTPLTP